MTYDIVWTKIICVDVLKGETSKKIHQKERMVKFAAMD